MRFGCSGMELALPSVNARPKPAERIVAGRGRSY
jgi:hypothetical protein